MATAKKLVYRYEEGKTVEELATYIESTYGQHYVGKEEIQTLDVWATLGTAESTCRDTAIKYLMRYGKKGGKNRKDLFKALHYIVLMLYFTSKE